MAVYDDYDGVYFTIQSIRLLHAAELGHIEFLIIDNHPDGPSAAGLRTLAGRVPRCRYVPFGGFHSTAVRDMIFREATTEYVLCLDAHVLLPAGTLRTLLDYFQANPRSRDLIQGPMLYDSLSGTVATHFDDEWGAEMWGRWGTDPRGQDPHAEPFEIGMQGLGLFACRRDAWPGLNPKLRGHGGEEGCPHERYRRAGARVICHPGVRWVHRSFRGEGAPYPTYWRDRARNYLILFDELGWDIAGLEKHLHELFDEVNPDKPRVSDHLHAARHCPSISLPRQSPYVDRLRTDSVSDGTESSQSMNRRIADRGLPYACGRERDSVLRVRRGGPAADRRPAGGSARVLGQRQDQRQQPHRRVRPR
jgi:hypothetical protein